jgi:hypothetical protein
MPTLQYLEDDAPQHQPTTTQRSLLAGGYATTPQQPQQAQQPTVSARPAMPPAMDNTHAFAPLPGAAPQRTPCRNCRGGRGDVNVNVNVSTGQHSSAGATQDAARPTMEGTTPQDIRTAVREAIAEARPTMEGTAKPTVEYRPFAVPQDRIVKQVEYRPFAAVWDRVKRTFVDRDVAHPQDRVKVVPATLVKGAMETPVPRKPRTTP